MRERLALVGDIGGTNARFALTDLTMADPAPPELISPRAYHCADFPQLEDAVEQYLKDVGGPRPDAATLAVAGPVANGAITFTNGGWTLSEAELKRRGFAFARLINDFEAMALGSVALGPGDVVRIGPDVAGQPGRPVMVVGAGTGLGVAGLAYGEGGAVACATEGGHVSFAPADEVEIGVLRVLMHRFGRVSLERLLSGPGLQNLYAALAEVEGRTDRMGAPPSPDLITGRALDGSDPFCAAVVERFCAILGTAAGDFALGSGALGGVYIAGGIAPRILPLLKASRFRERFEAKGRFEAYMRPIPTAVIVHPYAALLGARHALRMAERNRFG